MNRIFLGKWWHWAILVVSVAALWFAGDKRMHVIHFNTFILSLIAVTAVVIAFLVAKSRPGEQITRDPLEWDVEAAPEGETVRRDEND